MLETYTYINLFENPTSNIGILLAFTTYIISTALVPIPYLSL